MLIDNIEFLNKNSINALLKILEEPNENIFFILINSNKKILQTLKSRCIDFKISLSHQTSLEVSNKLVQQNISNLINKDLINYYFTPGKIYNLIQFSNRHDIDILKLDLKEIILLLMENSYYKKEQSLKNFLFECIEHYFLKKIPLENVNAYNNFLKKINNVKKFNLDEDTLFLEFKSKVLNG